MRKKLYLVGIDGLPVWIVKELSGEKGFEGFRRLIDSNRIVEAESVLPPVTASAWPSIYTGLKPSEHHVGDFFVLTKNYAPDILFYDSERVKPVWEKLAEHGLRCLVITPAAVIKPSRSRNVDMITGFPLPPRTNSRQLGALIRKFGFVGESNIGRRLRGETIDLHEAAKRLADDVRARARIAKAMIERHGYDFSFVCFTEIDTLAHFAIGRRDWKAYIMPLFKEINDFVEYLMRRVDGEDGSALMLVSDHGLQKIESKFLINAWLVKNGYARLKEPISALAARELNEENGKGERIYVMRDYFLKTRLRLIYKSIPLSIRPHLIRLAERLALRRKKKGYLRIYTFDFDMSKTRAFAFMSVDPVCAIWINDKRFKSGCVGNAEKKTLLLRLRNELLKAKDARGRTLFTNIYEGKKYYGKGEGLMLPDLFAEARNGVTADSLYYSDRDLFMDPGNARSGDHTRLGIFGLYSRDFHVRTNDFSILCVAPSILSFYGIRQ